MFSSCNRPDQLQDRLQELSDKTLSSFLASVYIVDDGSDQSLKPLICEYQKQIPNLRFYRFEKPHGKQKYWQVINWLLTTARGADADYFCKIDDDFEMPPDFLKQCFHLWDVIDDPQKLALHLFCPKGDKIRRSWSRLPTKFRAFQGHKFFTVGWLDCHFFSERAFLDKLQWRIAPIPQTRWEGSEKHRALSSGVGQQISLRMKNKGHFYIPDRQLIEHRGNHCSIMHPGLRTREQL